MIVGTAGHVDHGKTALVKALTGVDADRLKEEKARGITIDLGFAYADLGGGAVTGFVDVPGHEGLVHTMLAGAGGIDLALLVVAADDGVMPQTREHLAILDLLAVPRALVALSKADLADPALLAARRAEIAALLAGTRYAGAAVLPVSAVTGAGIGALKSALVAAERSVARPAAGGRFRLTVDRAFTLSGAGTVVTGTVLSGAVAVGEQVVVSPAGRSARIRGIHAQNRPAERARTGQRAALNLSGDGIARDALHRGDVVLDPALHAPTARIDAELRILDAEPKAIGTWFPARLHTGAAETGVRLVPLGGPLAPGASGLAQLVLDAPIAAAVGDRFILRDVSARRTIAGGRVLDLRPPARKRATPERLAQLAAMAHPDPDDALAALLATPPGFVDLPAFARDRGVAVEALSPGAFARLGPLVLAQATLAALREDLGAVLAAFHADNPELQGMAREKLRLALSPRLPKEPFLAFLRDAAGEGRVAIDGAFVRRPDHTVQLLPADEALYAALAPGLGGAARFRPPRVRDVAAASGVDEREIRRVLKLCARLGRVDQIAQDHFFLRATTAEMAAIAIEVAAARPDGWFPAAAFRDRMDNGRKVAIQILDFFDRHGLTLRRGDLRRINPHRADLFGTPS